jgi:hypothetical protein
LRKTKLERSVISSDFMSPKAGPIIWGSDAAANVLLRVIVPRMCGNVSENTSSVRIGFHCFVFVSAKA